MEHRKELLDALKTSFTLEEMSFVCFELNINVQSIPNPAATIDRLVIGLLGLCERSGRLEELRKACETSRPHIPWSSLFDRYIETLDGYITTPTIVDQVLPTPPPQLFGRENELTQLQAFICDRANTTSLRFACVCGLPGHGKTAFVARAVIDTKPETEQIFNQVRWIDALDNKLDLDRIQKLLQEHSQSANLLVLDNLSEDIVTQLEAVLRNYSPKRGSKLIVICTVRLGQPDTAYFELSKLDPESAQCMFVANWREPINDSERRAIRAIVGDQLVDGHPLAISLIANHAKVSNINLWQLWLDCQELLSTESKYSSFVTPVRERILCVYEGLNEKDKHLLQWLLQVRVPFTDDLFRKVANAIGNTSDLTLLSRESYTRRFILLKNPSHQYYIPVIVQRVLDKAFASKDSVLAANIIVTWKSKSESDQLRQESLATFFETGEYGQIINTHLERYSNVFAGLDIPKANSDPLSRAFAAYALANWYWQQARRDIAGEWTNEGILALEGINVVSKNVTQLNLRLHITNASAVNAGDSMNYVSSFFELEANQTQYPYEHAKWLLLQGRIKRFDGDSEGALDLLQRAEHGFRYLSSDRVQLLKAISSTSTALTDIGKFAESNEKNREALDIAQSSDASLEVRQLQLDCLNNLLDNETKLGNFEKAIQYANDGQKLMEDRVAVGLLNNRILLLVTHALMAFDLKNVDACLALQREAKVVSSLSGINDYNGYLDILDLWIQSNVGEKSSAQYRLSELEDQYLSDTKGDPDTAMLYSLVQSHVDCELGLRDIACKLLDRAAQSFRESNRPYHVARMNLAQAEILAEQTGSQHKMLGLLNEAQTIFEEIGATYYSDKTKALLARVK